MGRQFADLFQARPARESILVTGDFTLPHNRCGSAGTLQHGSRGGGLFAVVAHADDAWRVPGSGRSRDVADFFAVESEERVWLGHGVAGEEEFDAATVDLAAGAHALDDFLPGVAAFGVADVGVLQTGFVRDLFFAEVVAEPGDALSEAGRAQRGVSHGPAAVLSRRIRENLPKGWQVSGFGDELGAGDSSWRALRDTAGNRADGAIMGGKVVKL